MLSFFKDYVKRWVGWGKRVRDRLFQHAFVRFSYNVAQTLGKDYVGIMAAGISYYAFLSIFPLLVGLIAILGFLLPSESIYDIIFNFLQQNVPISTDFIESTIRNIIDLRGTLGLIGIGGLIFGGTAVLSAISLAVNRAWNLWPRPIWIRKPQEFVMVLVIGVIILLLLGISTGLSFLDNIALPGIGLLQYALFRLISFLLVLAIFLLLYKFIPNTQVRWSDIWRGALLGAIMFELALFGFTVFLRYFATYDIIYGSLASIVIILIWIYISSFILILCAEINSVYNRMFRQRLP